MTKACAGCGLVLPLERFSKVNGKPKSRCKDCLRADRQDDLNRHRARARADAVLANHVHRGVSPNPLHFSRLVCEHVSTYVERAIKRWESTTGMEAPPYLGALKQVSDGFVREHPRHQCLDCGCELPKGTPASRKYCAACRSENRLERQREASRRFRQRQRRRALLLEAKPLIQDAECNLAQMFRACGLSWQEVADRMGLSGTGAAYNKADPKYLEHIREYNKRRYYRMKEMAQ